jgi:hypothetical protein
VGNLFLGRHYFLDIASVGERPMLIMPSGEVLPIPMYTICSCLLGKRQRAPVGIASCFNAFAIHACSKQS